MGQEAEMWTRVVCEKKQEQSGRNSSNEERKEAERKIGIKVEKNVRSNRERR